ncbi:MAG: UDP-N-acetylmuramate--L-alanine ligase [Vicinamibacterales bacterium]
MLGKTRRIHFVGVGGIGMSGIAELLANLDYEVSGSDARASAVTDRLRDRCGVTVFEGHAASNVGEADVVVVSSAVKPGNAEVVEARHRGIPVIPRAEMLGELMRLRFSVAVAGAHGKTTTTSMIAVVLEHAGLDPTAVIGGRLSAFGSNARLGRGTYMVAEADESDRSFLVLSPSVAVITNIDREHMESYGGFEDLQQAFVAFANRVPFYGAVVACADDPLLSPLLPQLKRRVVSYGLETPDATFVGTGLTLGAFGARATVHRHHKGALLRMGELTLSVPGRHNVLNALAAIAVADELGVDFAIAAEALSGFQGAERRFEKHGEASGIAVIDDYGHHPTEIAAVLAAARTISNRRLVVVFQPHRYSRTAQLLDDFGPSLREADEIVLTDIYAAGEEPIPGVSVEALAEAVTRGSRRPTRIAHTLDDVLSDLMRTARPGDVVLTLGAGSIGTLPARLLEALRHREGAGR